MIKQDNTNVVIKFGTSDNATISVSSTKGTLTLQELANSKSIGDMLNPEDIKNLPKVQVEFFSLVTLYSFINSLDRIKDNWDKNYDKNMIFDNFDSNENIVAILSDGLSLVEPKITILTKLELKFFKIQSIDVLLSALRTIERNWTDDANYYLAC